MKPVLFLLGVFTLAFCGCEKPITVHEAFAAPEVVVEGYIYVGKPPVVILTQSLPYFSEITSARVDSSYIHGAVITVSNGEQTQTLREYVIDTTNGNPYYYYSGDTSQPGEAFTGEAGGTYTLNIRVLGQTFAATTTIPSGGDVLDSLWALFPPTKKDSGRAVLMGMITNPAEPDIYIRYFTKVNSGPFLPGETSVYDDELTEGTTYATQIEPGLNKNNPPDSGKTLFYQGDTVVVELCNIDEATYNFWRTYDYSYSNTSNPFSSPIQVLGNVPGALGYWGGYEQQYKTLVIP